jgi:hypothetical protein
MRLELEIYFDENQDATKKESVEKNIKNALYNILDNYRDKKEIANYVVNNLDYESRLKEITSKTLKEIL